MSGVVNEFFRPPEFPRLFAALMADKDLWLINFKYNRR
jgi:hypothetical protein